MLKVSVIVPVYKVEKYLMQCIDSVLNQTLKDIELILVDEGDLDECRAIIDMYEKGVKRDERVKSIHQRNGGYGASVNKGIDLAKGEYIFILESDDFIALETLEELYDYAKLLDADIVKTPYYEYWDKNAYSDEIIKDCAWSMEFDRVPEDTVFSIEDYPQFLSVHPSIWSALYKKAFLQNNNIRFVEAKGAGYVDNYFRIETLCTSKRIAWKNKAYNYYRLSNPDASQVRYDLSAFILRWNEVHKIFETKFADKKEILYPYCLVEEYTNIFKPLFRKKNSLSEDDYQLLLENLNYITVRDINSSNLSKTRKRRLLELKNKPQKIKRFLGVNKSMFGNLLSILKGGCVNNG